MPKGFDPNKVADGWPRGIYHLYLESCVAKETQDGRFTLNLTAKIKAPEQFEDKPFYKTFYLGTEDDPQLEKPGWAENNFAARDLKKMVRAADLPDEVLADFDDGIEVYDSEVLVDIGPRMNNKTGIMYSNNTFGWYAVGTKTAELQEDDARDAASAADTAEEPKKRTRKKAIAADEPEEAPKSTLTCPGCKEAISKKEFSDHTSECPDVVDGYSDNV